ncbi:MAG: hypothetical protein HZA22_07520 [Nitrospirae bacterium]|nr:hypothetical protein [Nitrospirota bacterium]
MQEARLELMIRKPCPDGRGFVIKEVPSGLVYAGYRPVRLAPGKYDVRANSSPVEGKRYYVLKAHESQKYLSLNEREYYLWELMDGSRNIREIASQYFFQFGSLDFTAIKGLLSRLRDAGLVEFEPASRLRVAADRSSSRFVKYIRGLLGRLEYRIEDADGWVTRFYERGGWLLVNEYAVILFTLLSVAGISAFGRFSESGIFPFEQMYRHPVLFVAAALLSVYPIAAIHEIFHALACKRFGRKVYAFGFTLWDGFYPSFYTDVSDIYLSSRKERLIVSLAGPLSTTAVAALFFIPVAVVPDAWFSETFYNIGCLSLIIGVVSLYPFQFIKMDGYYILVDLLGFPGLRERTFAFVRSLPGFIGKGMRFSRADAIMTAYFLLSLLSIIGAAAYIYNATTV